MKTTKKSYSDYVDKYKFTFSKKPSKYVLWNYPPLSKEGLSCSVTSSNSGSSILETSSPFPHSTHFAVGCHLIILLPLTMRIQLRKHLFFWQFFTSLLFFSSLMNNLYLAVRSFSGLCFLKPGYRHNISAHTSPNTSKHLNPQHTVHLIWVG